MSDDHPERIAVLETEVRGIKEVLNRIEPMVAETHSKVSQWGGIVTGIAIAISTLWAMALGIWTIVKHKFR